MLKPDYDDGEKIIEEQEHPSSTAMNRREKEYNLPERFTLEERDHSFYFTPRNNTDIIGCFTAGSIHPEPGSRWPCVCQKGYFGPHCAIPEVVMTSACQSLDSCEGIKVRSSPRRIIHFFNFHHELDHAEVLLGELADVVDVFVIGESNRTTSGEPNELLLLPKIMNEGFLEEYHSKMIYVMIPSTAFPEDRAGHGGGWISDSFIRNYIGEKGLARIDGWKLYVMLILDAIVVLNYHICNRNPR